VKPFIKICGITDPATAHTAVDAGADALGFVFSPSPRRLTPQEATSICRNLERRVLHVAVFRMPSQSDVDRVLESFDADLVQADQRCRLALPANVDRLPVIRGVQEPSVDPEPTTSPLGPLVLYEGLKSGVGERADWVRARRLSQTARLILAGGLDPRNVGEAVRFVRPFGVDVSSGVESTPGKKSPALITSFISSAREAAEGLIKSESIEETSNSEVLR
jgi:phosphoribosylanthranilate isomerase